MEELGDNILLNMSSTHASEKTRRMNKTIDDHNRKFIGLFF